MSVLSTFAQNSGDIVSGTVNDAYGPVIGANVVELDGANRIVASTVTDINGNFSLKIVSPKNKLRFTYVGHKTVTQSINKLQEDIEDAESQCGSIKVSDIISETAVPEADPEAADPETDKAMDEIKILVDDIDGE